MKKVITTLFVLLLAVGYSNAQPDKYIGVGAELAFAGGDDAKLFDLSTGFGGGIRYEKLMFEGNASANIGVSYLVWSGDYKYSYLDNNYSMVEKSASAKLSALQFLAGYKIYVLPTVYLGLEAVYTSFSMSVDGGETIDDFPKGFGYAGGMGLAIPMGSLVLDISAMYKVAQRTLIISMLRQS